MPTTEHPDGRPAPCAHLCAHPDLHPTPVCNVAGPYPHGCADCPAYRPGLDANERTRCEVWTRVMGYHRPVGAFNAGKQSEHHERQHFREPGDAPILAPLYPHPVGKCCD